MTGRFFQTNCVYNIRVVANGRLAIFDLGIVVGLMVVDVSQEDVTKLVQDGKWKADLLDVEELDNESESEDASSDEKDSVDERTSGNSEISDYNTGDDPETPIDLTSNHSAKRQKIKHSHPRRLYFQWRGYSTVSGAVNWILWIATLDT